MGISGLELNEMIDLDESLKNCVGPSNSTGSLYSISILSNLLEGLFDTPRPEYFLTVFLHEVNVFQVNHK